MHGDELNSNLAVPVLKGLLRNTITTTKALLLTKKIRGVQESNISGLLARFPHSATLLPAVKLIKVPRLRRHPHQSSTAHSKSIQRRWRDVAAVFQDNAKHLNDIRKILQRQYSEYCFRTLAGSPQRSCFLAEVHTVQLDADTDNITTYYE